MITATGREVEVRIVDKEGQAVATLPEARVESMSWVLNNYGQMNFTQSTHSPGAEWAARLHEYEAQVWIDNQLMWWGVLVSEGGGPGVQSIGCDGLFSYFEERMIDDRTLEWFSEEQFFIGRDLIQYAQSEQYQANRDLNIGVSIPSPSGKVRTERYSRPDHAIISELIVAFSQLSDGFDFDIEFTPDGQRLWVPYYPKKGVRHTNLLLEYGRNLETYTFSRSTANMRTQTYVAGGAVPNAPDDPLGGGGARMEQVYEDVAASAKYGVMQKVVSEGSQMDTTWLLEKATEDVRLWSTPEVLPEVTAIELEEEPLLGVIDVGDEVAVRIVDGQRIVEGYYRIKQITWSSNERLGITFHSREED